MNCVLKTLLPLILPLSFVVGMTCAAPAADGAQPTGTHRIGVIMQPVASQQEGLRQGLRELGYIEGKNLVIEWRPSSARNEELQLLAAELGRSGVELIVASGTPAARAASQTTTLPGRVSRNRSGWQRSGS